jgi:hypothetical protein
VRIQHARFPFVENFDPGVQVKLEVMAGGNTQPEEWQNNASAGAGYH